MKQKLEAVYENGLFRPLRPLNLEDQQRVSLTVETDVADDWLDREAVLWAQREGDPDISLEDVRRRLAKLGSSLANLVIAERGEY